MDGFFLPSYVSNFENCTTEDKNANQNNFHFIWQCVFRQYIFLIN